MRPTWRLVGAALRILGCAALVPPGCAAVAIGLAGSASAQAPTAPAPLQAGVASRVVTPVSPGQFLAGLKWNRVAQGAHDDLYARTLALRAADITLVLCTVDVIGLLATDVGLVREQVEGVPAERVLISATHTHSGPDTIGLWGRRLLKRGTDPKYMAFLRTRIGESISEALQALGPAEIRFAVAQTPPNTHQNRQAPEEIDHDIGVLQVRRPSGEMVATLVNWGCHPTVLQDRMITSDFPGYLRQQVEEDEGGTALFFQGIVGGGVRPDRQSDTQAEAERIGRAVGAAAVAAIRDAPWVQALDLRTRREAVSLPVGSLGFRLAGAVGLVPRFKGRTLTTEVNLVDLGGAQILTLPGEVVPALGLKMKGLLKSDCRFVFGLTSDELAYILPEEYFHRKGYRYEAFMSVGRKTGPRLYEAVNRLVTAPP